jgi:Ca2+-binding RTX toxin-like protein
MVGGIGNDAYGIDSLSDVIIENANEGIDAAIFFANNYTLASNVENGNVGSTTGLALTGNELGNALVGNSGADILDGGAGIDSLFGWTGDDTFVFHAGQANGDTVIDFAGNGSNPGDQLQFVGYGTAAQGATLTQQDATHWQVNSFDGAVHDTITLSNGASLSPTDFLFL